MTLTEIKTQLENLIKNLTVDDLYVISPLQIAKQEFGVKLGWKTEAEAEAWLSKEFKNSDARVHSICSAKEISDITKVRQHKIQQVENWKTELLEREQDADNRFRVLSSDYSSQKITYMEYDAQNKIIEQYKKETRELRKTRIQTEDEIKKHRETILRLKRTAKQIDANGAEFFANESASLNYLFKVLFFKEILLQPVEGYVQNSSGFVFNMAELDNAVVANTIEYKKATIDYVLIKNNIGIKEVMESLVTASNSTRTIPSRWKTILEETLSLPIPDKFGSLAYANVNAEDYDSEKNNGFCFSSYETPRTNRDEALLLLLREASQTENYLTTENQKVLFALTGGASATLQFRKKGERMQTFFTRPLEIVRSQIYTTTEKPGTESYYLITHDYVIEVDFIFQNIIANV